MLSTILFLFSLTLLIPNLAFSYNISLAQVSCFEQIYNWPTECDGLHCKEFCGQLGVSCVQGARSCCSTCEINKLQCIGRFGKFPCQYSSNTKCCVYKSVADTCCDENCLCTQTGCVCPPCQDCFCSAKYKCPTNSLCFTLGNFTSICCPQPSTLLGNLGCCMNGDFCENLNGYNMISYLFNNNTYVCTVANYFRWDSNSYELNYARNNGTHCFYGDSARWIWNPPVGIKQASLINTGLGAEVINYNSNLDNNDNSDNNNNDNSTSCSEMCSMSVVVMLSCQLIMLFDIY